MYKVNFGPQIGERDRIEKGEIFRSLRDEFKKIFGVYLAYGNNIFALIEIM